MSGSSPEVSPNDEAVGDVPQPGLPAVLTELLSRESSFRAFVRRRVGDDALAEDLLQQSLVRAVEQQHTVENQDSVVAWFYRILRHAVIDYYRAHAADERKVDGFRQELATRGEDQVPAPDDWQPAVCACLHRLLPGLRPAYADLLRRIDLNGEAPTAVAQELGVTVNNLTVRLHRARQALRAGLEQSCGVCTKHGCLHCTCD
ncbi:MAG: sigma-70 family RNA polymerase sigma factor [Nitrospira sp.]